MKRETAKTRAKKRIANRIELVKLANEAARRFAHPSEDPTGHRVVVIVTDADGDFVGVGMNTSGDDADSIMRCAIFAEGLEYHDAKGDYAYSRTGRTTRTTIGGRRGKR